VADLSREMSQILRINNRVLASHECRFQPGW
jgi:hypothetical protein